MGQRSDQIKDEIERTRSDLTVSLDEVGDRISPRRVAQRKMTGLRDRVEGAKTTVMGKADDARHAPDAMRDSMRSNVEGNPLAAGIIAFGAGLLFGSILPASDAEERMGSRLAEGLEPAVGKAREAAGELRSGMMESAREATEHVKDEAKSAMADVREGASNAATEVRDDAKSAASEVRQHA